LSARLPDATASHGVVPKSGHHFSEKITPAKRGMIFVGKVVSTLPDHAARLLLDRLAGRETELIQSGRKVL